ncbi:vacuolar protein sorting-associated protein 35B-like [Gossypium australe]|uniref:Vacuolar protein sorting-associated protein 35B-like n=1 Tax=Gossypium australe TaxID=47621 RepID=A0A5B6VVS3_9ROSI|nr:vacuolar protein sorting-associated protein 35B-like [Gossypium australe]
MVKGYCFSADLMLLTFDEFDVILGMDWLTQQDAVVNCKQQYIVLKCQNGELLHIESDKLDGFYNVISVSESKIKSVPVVYEFPDVFLEELPEEATWEPEETMRKQYPNLFTGKILEDEINTGLLILVVVQHMLRTHHSSYERPVNSPLKLPVYGSYELLVIALRIVPIGCDPTCGHTLALMSI